MIIFKKISIKNFLSIGNKPVELELNTHNITSALDTQREEKKNSTLHHESLLIKNN